jgi:hypothetical protein
MARVHDFLGTGKVVPAAGGTIIFSGNELPGSTPGASLVALHLRLEGGGTTAANNATLDNITRIRVKANGGTLYDCTYVQLRALLETFQWSNGSPAAGGVQVTIPFYMMDDRASEEMQDLCAFPLGATPSLELTFGPTTDGCTVFPSWTLSDVNPTNYPVFYASQMNIALGAVNGSVPIMEDGFVRALTVPITGLSRFRAIFGGVQRVHAQGRVADLLATGQAGHGLTEYNAFRSPLTAGISGGGTLSTSGTAVHKVVGMSQAPPGSRVEIDTVNYATAANDWAGTTNELGIWAIRPQMRRAG